LDLKKTEKRGGGQGESMMAQEQKQENQVEESRKSVAGRALRFIKKTAGWLANIAAIRKKQQKNSDCPQKAKSAQEVRDQLQNRCPWWGP